MSELSLGSSRRWRSAFNFTQPLTVTMEHLLGVVLIVLVVGTAAALLTRHLRPISWVIAVGVLYIPMYFVWFVIQYLRIVSVDEFFHRTFGVYSYQLVGTALGAIVQFGPPMLPSIVLLGWLLITGRVTWSAVAQPRRRL